MNEMELYLYIICVSVPLGFFGMVYLFKLLIGYMKVKRGFVKTLETTENGELKEKWIKPISGQVQSKDGSTKFNFNVGYIWRMGFFPVTLMDGKSKTQINLTSTGSDDVGAKDASNLIIRSYNEGFIDGFKKNKMMNNLIIIILIAAAIAALAGIFGYQQNTQQLDMLGRLLSKGG